VGKSADQLRCDLGRFLRLHEDHNTLIWAGRQISGIGPLVEERKRIEEELEAVAKEARALDASRSVSGPPTQPYGQPRCSR
jgi:hypothetical protein